MADTNIAGLPSGAAITDTDLFAGSDAGSGTLVKKSGAQLKTYMSVITAPTGGSTVGARTVGFDVTSGNGPFDVGGRYTKSQGAKAGLDVEGPYNGGRLARFWNRNWSATYSGNYPDIPTYIGDRGQIVTQAWVTISGTFTGTGDDCEITQPTNDTYMLGIWSDIGDAAIAVRASVATGSYLLQGFDSAGHYRFRLNADGTLAWGTSSTKASEDVSLSRIAGPGLKLSGSIALTNNSALQWYKADGTTLINLLQVDSSNNVNLGSASLGGHWQITPATGKEFRIYNSAFSKYLVRIAESALTFQSDCSIRPGSSVVASLPSAASAGAGATYYASNGRKSGEGAGAGTGIPVWSDGTSWRTYYDNTVAAA